jgi:sarcosine oxidase subunit alpha
LAAALAAGRSGARVILCDEQQEFGGALLSGNDEIDGMPAAKWVADATAELADMADVRVLPRTTAYGYYDHNSVWLVERTGDHLPPGSSTYRQRLWKVRAKQVVLATGAIERPLVFADNDRPGIMLAGAARTYANRYGALPGRRVVVMTNNDSAYQAAIDLAQAGTTVAAIVDLRANADGAAVAAARGRNIEVLAGHAITGTKGRKRVSAVSVVRMSEAGDSVIGAVREIECDLVLHSGGWNPTVHLFSQSGGKLRFDADIAAFVPDRSVQKERSAGAAKGSFALADCLDEGFDAGRAAARDAGFTGDSGTAPRAEPAAAEAPLRPIWVVPSVNPVGHGAKFFVDHQNDATAADVLLAEREGYRSVEPLKRYTTTGMGTDQGKTSNVNALAILSETVGAAIPAVGTTTFRPPYTPVTIGAFASRDLGDLLDPIRRTPTHGWAEKVGAPFENVGQWKRAWYFPKPGETMLQAVNREVKAARTSIGVVDASTLGKIDIQGPDGQALNCPPTPGTISPWHALRPDARRDGW